VYVAKMLYAVIDMAGTEEIPPGSSVLALVTG
jgi:hypothetical protein